MTIVRALRLALAALLGAASAEALAETPLPLAPGAKIKIETRTNPSDRVGTLVALGDSALSFQPSGNVAAIEIPHSDIAALAVADGHRSRWRNALVGFGIGAASGFLLGYASGDDDHGAWEFFWLSAEEKGLILAAVFAPVGGIVGLALRPGERWRDVPIESLRVAPHVTSAGEPGLAVTLRF